MAKFEEGDTVVIAQEGFYQGVEATVEEVFDSGHVVVDLPVGFYNKVVAKSDGSYGYPWHGETTKGGFHEEELVKPSHSDAKKLKSNAVEIAEHPSEFGGGN